MPTLNGAAVGCGLDDLCLTTVLILKCDLCGLTGLDGYGLSGCGVIDPVLALAVSFRHLVSAGFQVQGDNTSAVRHIVTDLSAAGGLDSEVPTLNRTAVGCGLDDLRLTSPLIGKGHAGSFTGLNRNGLGCRSIIDPILVAGCLLCYRVSAGFQLKGNDTGCRSSVGSNGSTGSILDRKGPACHSTAVGGFLDDLRSTLGFFGNHIEVQRNRVTGCLLQRDKSLIGTGLPKIEGLVFQIGDILGCTAGAIGCTTLCGIKRCLGSNGQFIAADRVGQTITILKGTLTENVVGIRKGNGISAIALLSHFISLGCSIVTACKAGEYIMRSHVGSDGVVCTAKSGAIDVLTVQRGIVITAGGNLTLLSIERTVCIGTKLFDDSFIITGVGRQVTAVTQQDLMDDDLSCKLIGQHGLLGGTGHTVGCTVKDSQANSSLGINIQVIPGRFGTAISTGAFGGVNTGVNAVRNRSATICDNTMDVQTVYRVVLVLIGKVQFGFITAKPNDGPVVVSTLHCCARSKQHRNITGTDGDSAGSDIFFHVGDRIGFFFYRFLCGFLCRFFHRCFSRSRFGRKCFLGGSLHCRLCGFFRNSRLCVRSCFGCGFFCHGFFRDSFIRGLGRICGGVLRADVCGKGRRRHSEDC